MKALSQEQRTRRRHLEAILEETAPATERFLETLALIYTEGLYDDYNSFAEYCERSPWFARTGRRGRQLVNYFTTVQEIREAGGTIVPANEGQSRELNSFEPAVKAAVMETVGKNGTAREIHEVAGQVKEYDELKGKSKEEVLEVIRRQETAAEHNEQRELFRQLSRICQRGIQTADQIGPEASDLVRQLEKVITACCQRGNFDRPRGKKKSRVVV